MRIASLTQFVMSFCKKSKPLNVEDKFVNVLLSILANGEGSHYHHTAASGPVVSFILSVLLLDQKQPCFPGILTSFQAIGSDFKC